MSVASSVAALRVMMTAFLALMLVSGGGRVEAGGQQHDFPVLVQNIANELKNTLAGKVENSDSVCVQDKCVSDSVVADPHKVMQIVERLTPTHCPLDANARDAQSQVCPKIQALAVGMKKLLPSIAQSANGHHAHDAEDQQHAKLSDPQMRQLRQQVQKLGTYLLEHGGAPTKAHSQSQQKGSSAEQGIVDELRESLKIVMSHIAHPEKGKQLGESTLIHAQHLALTAIELFTGKKLVDAEKQKTPKAGVTLGEKHPPKAVEVTA